MLYMVPGLLAGVVFYLILTAFSWSIETISSKKYRLRAHVRLLIQCLVAITFTIFLATAGGGGNWATQMQVSGFILAGCALSLITSITDKSHPQGKAEQDEHTDN